MTSGFPEESLIRRYILSDVTEEERVDVEKRLMTDDEFFNQIEAVRDEIVDDYVDGLLSEEDRARLEQHFLSTPEGQQRVTFARALGRHIDKVEGRDTGGIIPIKHGGFLPFVRNSPSSIKAFALFLVVIGAGLFLWRLYFFESDIRKGTLALQAAYPQARPTESRISEMVYAPWSVTRSGKDRVIDQDSLTEAQGLLAGAARKSPGAATSHALGRYYLAEGHLDEAIERFTEAIRAEPGDARFHSDLGAAYIEKGKLNLENDRSGRWREDLMRALGPLNKALELDSSLLEALFNRALCHQYLEMLDLAEEGWNSYLEKDASSPWADEAREKLDKIREQRDRTYLDTERTFEDFIVAFRARDRTAAEALLNEADVSSRNSIIDRLAAIIAGKPENPAPLDPVEALAAMRFAAEVRERPPRGELRSDRYLADLVRAYSATNPAARRTLAYGRRQLEKAIDNLRRAKGGMEENVSLYEEAIRSFSAAGSRAEAASARFGLAQYRLRASQPEKSLALAGKLKSECESLKYERLLGQTMSLTAQAYTFFDDSKAALDNARQALGIFQRAGAPARIIGQYTQIALIYQNIHDGRQALVFLQRAFVEGANLRLHQNQRLGLLDAAADVCEALSLNDAAVDFQRESLRRYEATNALPFDLSRSYALFGSMLLRLSRFDDAKSNLLRSLELGEKIEDRDQRRDAVAFASLRLGQLYLQLREHQTALDYYNRRIEYFGEVSYTVESYYAHKGRLLCYLALGRDQDAAEEIKTVLRMFEDYRPKITEEASRNAFFDRENDTYDIAIEFAYTKLSNPHAAFDYCEASHGRSLLDGAGQAARLAEKEYGVALELAADQRPLSLMDVEKELPASVQLVQYAVLNDMLLAWVVTKDGTKAAISSVQAVELEAQVNRYLDALQSRSNYDEAEVKRRAGDLHDLIIKPIEPFLDPNKVICVVPDKVLNRLPLGSLLSKATGKRVIEEYALVVDSSATLFIKHCRLAREKAGRSGENFLAIGGPNFDKNEFDLKPLPDARDEAEVIGSFYGSPPILTGDNAREAVVRQALQAADVVQFATHYVVDLASYMKSGLLLTAEPLGEKRNKDIDGVLRAGDVYAMKLPRTKLVLLSACNTGIEQSLRGEGAIGMARPFLTAGVPQVVASLWPVETRATRELMIEFHKLRKEGRSTVEALRRAQNKMLEKPISRASDSNVWAAFVVIGGLEDYLD